MSCLSGSRHMAESHQPRVRNHDAMTLIARRVRDRPLAWPLGECWTDSALRKPALLSRVWGAGKARGRPKAPKPGGGATQAILLAAEQSRQALVEACRRLLGALAGLCASHTPAFSSREDCNISLKTSANPRSMHMAAMGTTAYRRTIPVVHCPVRLHGQPGTTAVASASGQRRALSPLPTGEIQASISSADCSLLFFSLVQLSSWPARGSDGYSSPWIA
ncbi:hypothetical protein Micbo1qcDRAFT_225978 [Microdochium bolleyi]|uniref:Uncharacterized protein n=1 Tax=Microdochium bolleyi TaxID=196109 RepID=A0A136J222_9PEZI|nr:hypothetical protein Micbo1qcDRAFT_225978 [Microdochium bolleyi]